VIAMMTRDISALAALDVNSASVPELWRDVDQDELTLRQSETSFRLATTAGEISDATVEILPADSVKRHSTTRYGITAESIYVPARSTITINYRSRMHLLVLHEDGARSEGETSIDELPASRLRKLTNKLTFVPAWHHYRESHETGTAMRLMYIYLDSDELQRFAHADSVYAPKIFFEDSILWATAIKLKCVLESGTFGTAYLQALVNVLAHELLLSGQKRTGLPPATRGGLAGWQARAVAAYIEEHLSEQISLVALAQLARLSTHHFCRAFKRSFGVPPHRYHLARRMQQAKVLLSDRTTSITEVSVILGFTSISSFSDTFRKISGQTPSQFRRSLK
jgi:AraC family transcriptional regulator